MNEDAVIPDSREHRPGAHRDGPEAETSTLLPMLIGGLVLIIVAMTLVAVFT